MCFHVALAKKKRKKAGGKVGKKEKKMCYWSFLSLFYTLKYAMFAELQGGFDPLGPLPGLCPGPTGAL
jgi:hypothetical protein